MSTTQPVAVTFDDVAAAAERLRGKAFLTPLLEVEALNQRAGGRVLVKAETLQRSGSFKFRGAYNAMSQITGPAVVAFSSGNHAQGVALAARLLGKAATIVMPADAPDIKIARTRGYGAQVVTYDRERESREEIGAEIAARTGAALIKPYDDPAVIAGQGTIGLEIARQAQELDAVPEVALAACSGGGLVTGCATALRHAFPAIEVMTVEPAGFDDMARSLAAGRRVSNEAVSGSICDALMAPMPGEITFPIALRLLKGGLAVSEAQVMEAIRFAATELKLVVEPGGAVTLAAILSGALPTQGRTVVIVLSGGNLDPAMLVRALAAAG